MSVIASIRLPALAPAVQVQMAGRPVAVATFATDGADAVDVSCHVDAGHLPVDIRRQLVEAIFAMPEVRSCRTLRLTIPLGDSALLRGIQDNCPDLLVRPAGATCLIDATMEPS